MKTIILILFILSINFGSFAQSLRLEQIFINEREVTLNLHEAYKLNKILNDDLSIPYSLFSSGLAVYGGYRIRFSPTTITTIYKPMGPEIDSLCIKQIKKDNFLKELSLSYDSIEQISIKLKINFDNFPSKRVIDIPLPRFGNYNKTLNQSLIGKSLSGNIEYLRKSKRGYVIKNGNNKYFVTSESVSSNKNNFKLDGNIRSIVQISNDSTFITVHLSDCRKTILTQYLLSHEKFIVTSKFELYGFPDDEKLKIDISNHDVGYMKFNNESLILNVKILCIRTHSYPLESLINIQPIGNVVGLIEDNSTIYCLSNDEHPEFKNYGIVESKIERTYKVYVGGWLE